MIDNFDYANWDEAKAAGWSLRGTTYGSTGSRVNSRADDRAVAVVDSTLILKVRPDPDNPGKHFVGHVKSPPVLDADGNPFVYGLLEARIQFGRPQGAHGSLWHQSGYGDGGAELDVVEWFGERMPNSDQIESQRVQHTVHTGPLDAEGKTFQYPRYTYTKEDNDVVDIPRHQGMGKFGLNKTWWNAYHKFGCVWSPTEYTFFVDGIQVGVTRLPASGYSYPTASIPGETILSLLSNDGEERDDLLAHIAAGGRYSDYDMRVSQLAVFPSLRT